MSIPENVQAVLAQVRQAALEAGRLLSYLK